MTRLGSHATPGRPGRRRGYAGVVLWDLAATAVVAVIAAALAALLLGQHADANTEPTPVPTVTVTWTPPPAPQTPPALPPARTVPIFPTASP